MPLNVLITGGCWPEHYFQLRIQLHSPVTNDEIREMIIGCAYKVYNRLGFGFVEKVYENALRVELLRNGLSAKQ